MNNIGAQLRLPKDDVEGIKLAAMGGSSKRDYLAFDCAMKDKGEVRYSSNLMFILFGTRFLIERHDSCKKKSFCLLLY